MKQVVTSFLDSGKVLLVGLLGLMDRAMLAPTRLYLQFLLESLGPLAFCMFSSVSIAALRHHRLVSARAQLKKLLFDPISPKRLPRATSMLVGIAVGDSFGAGVEFEDHEVIKSVVDGSRYVNMRGSYLISPYGKNYRPGYYTDDTEMTLGTCRFLLRYRVLLGDVATADPLLNCWLEEYRHTNTLASWCWRTLFGVGRSGHGSFKEFAQGKTSVDEMRTVNSERMKRYPGNGPVMRCLPLAFVDDENVAIKLSRMNANATHPHVKARASSLLLVLAARAYIFDESMTQETVLFSALERYIQVCKEHPDHFDQEMFEYLQAVDALEDYHDEASRDFPRGVLCGTEEPIGWATKSKGHVVRGLDSDAMRTVGCVLYLLKYYRNHMDCLLSAVRIGGDVDSIAAIVMGLVCARHGLTFSSSSSVMFSNSLPDFFLYELEGLEYIINVSRSFAEQFEH